MTMSRTARITSKTDKGFSINNLGTIDSNPDRTSYELEALNCSNYEFLDWFLLMDSSDGFCTDGIRLIDLGNTTSNLTTGSVITVTYQEIIEAWLNNKAVSAKADIAKHALAVRERLGIA